MRLILTLTLTLTLTQNPTLTLTLTQNLTLTLACEHATLGETDLGVLCQPGNLPFKGGGIGVLGDDSFTVRAAWSVTAKVVNRAMVSKL